MISVTGLWLNDKLDGEKYMKGYFGKAEVLIFSNKYKTEDNQPDYILYIAEKQREDLSTTPSSEDIEF